MKTSKNQATAAWLKVDGLLPPKVLQRFRSRDFSCCFFISPCHKKQHKMCCRGFSCLSGPVLELGGSNGRMLEVWGGQASVERL